MVSSIWYVIAVLDIFNLYGIGTSISIIGAIKEKNTNSPGECVILIIVGASIVALAGLMASVMCRILGG